MEQNPEIIKVMAAENSETLTYLLKVVPKLKPDEFDRLIHPISNSVSKQIDCTKCANCCKSLEAGISDEEAFIIAEKMKISIQEFNATYTLQEDQSNIRFIKDKPCPLLQDNKCSIYDSRPMACSTFPGFERPLLKYKFRSIAAHYSICPIVYHTFEILKVHFTTNATNERTSKQ